MRIENIHLAESGERVRAGATITWENGSRPSKEVFIETPAGCASGFTAAPEAFLVGCLIPALHFGEKRIFVEGGVCPGLLERLASVMALMRAWSGGDMQPLALEAETIREKSGLSPKHRTGMVYSGGVDSIATLRLNMLAYPENHSGAVKDCFFIHGFDIGGVVERGVKYQVFDRGLSAMKKVTSAANRNTIPVYTNLRHLCDDRDLWLNRFFGAVLAAVAHAFSARVDRFVIAASYDLDNLAPCGSHPLLDPWYSSFDVLIAHQDAHLRRMEKLQIAADWEPGFQNMRVCLANAADRLNCGRCEKCVRTMTGLAALGVLHNTRAFAENDVTPDMFDAFKINIRHREPFYIELLPLLEKRGRMDLVRTIRKKLDE